MGCDLAIHMGIHDHLVVEPVDAVVQHSPVRADLDAGHSAEDVEERQRVVDLGGDGVFPDPLINAPLSDRGRVTVTEQQPDTRAVRGLSRNVLGRSGISLMNMPT